MLSRGLLLVVLVAGAAAQDDAEAAAEGEGEEECVPCEEAWEYVEFLKTEVKEKVTQILQDFKGSTGADATVADTMDEVMSIREAILERIKGLRKGDIEICTDQNVKQEEKLSEFRMEVMGILLDLVDADASTIDNLKGISKKLLDFRKTISDEVMRLLMLPEPDCGKTVVNVEDCAECQVLADLKFTLLNLQVCSKKEDAEEAPAEPEAPAPAEDAPAEGKAAEPGSDCVEPIMYSMTLIIANEKLDEAIAAFYTQIIQATDEAERTKAFDKLTTLKKFREKVDEYITALIDEGEDAKKLKKYVSRNLRVLIIEVTTALEECNKSCGNEGGECESCAGPILVEALDKMEEYTIQMESEREDEEKTDFIRTDLINHINKINEDSRGILTAKVQSETGVLEECEADKLKVYNMIKGPMWMLVNTTIFSEDTSAITEMIKAMEEQLRMKLSEYCKNVPVEGPTDPEGPNCEWEEYEKTKEYLVEVDTTIQEGLFKVKEDSDKTKALLGFVKIQEMFDKRVKKLFEDKVQCIGELTFIKEKYMPQLTKCMIEFMNPKVKFTEMTRLQRISCIKTLRNNMEDRTANLLQFELKKSLDQLSDDGASK